MKTTYRKHLLTAIAALSMAALVSCDDVSPNDRYILGESVKAERGVLLEDFTGQACINCPDAHKVIEQLEERYGEDKLIAVSIHCGGFGLSTSRTDFSSGRIGLMTEEGNAIMEAYGIQSFPMGVINMGSPMVYDLWPTEVRNAIKVETDVNIDLDAEYVPDSRDGENGYFGTIDIKAEVKSGTDRIADIQFWIIENGIVATQRSTAGTMEDYVHNNVFRAQVFSGLRGSQISLVAGLPTETEGSIANRWTDKEHWVPENISVVAFVSDKSGVLQVVRKALFPADSETGEEEGQS
ncbi:MAG: Omp28 family outer membrane lipoprotein [Muribaculaceae bacterium]|nr:Omp28 family outer membrane lipoprotein [Muribaculaceae bacterium]